jgi:capsule polysaccharide modification protein KpsS
MDTIQDCLPTLFTLRWLPATTTLSDAELFGPAQKPAVQFMRQRFMYAAEANPPLVIVMVSGSFLDSTSGYSKLAAWPEFARWLDAHYNLVAERTPPHMVRWWSRPQPPAGYRLYVFKEVTGAAASVPR